MTVFQPKLHILPQAQRQLWPQLSQVPPRFVLYGGTALALRLEHRQSEDFDFFSSESFTPEQLIGEIPLLENTVRRQSEVDTLTVTIAEGAVKLSFFGKLHLSRVGQPERSPDNGIWIASLLDLAATKVAVVQDRGEAKDYIDIDALLRGGLSLPQCLGAARAVYGEHFNAGITLKALTYFEDGDLPSLPAAVKSRLARASAATTEVADVPVQSARLDG